jgi:N-acetylmuramic acid 6-phosphate (MurNAc-6-P) etherase
MVILKYIGAKRIGRLVASDFELYVEYGRTYDIPERLVVALLASGEWVNTLVASEEQKKKNGKRPF